MAVASSVTLPAQPAAGFVTYIPLGGDGWVAPQSMFEVLVQLASDASGGNSVTTIVRDDRFESVITRAETIISSAAAAADVQFELNTGITGRIPAISQSLNHRTALTGSSHKSWDLPPIFEFRNLVCRTDNVDATEVVNLRCWVYNFRISASQRTPLPILLASLPRSSWVSPL